jgi:hypothetical protein
MLSCLKALTALTRTTACNVNRHFNLAVEILSPDRPSIRGEAAALDGHVPTTYQQQHVIAPERIDATAC